MFLTPNIEITTIFQSENLFITLNQCIGCSKSVSINHHKSILVTS
jgi:hypothetical protein